MLTKERQERLKGKVHDAPTRLLSRLQHDLLLTNLAQVKPWECRKKACSFTQLSQCNLCAHALLGSC